MATHTIGTGGSFSTPQAWEDDLPATLTEPRTGQLKNQEFTSTDRVINFSAHVTSSSNFILLECESGASFKDNVNVRTNALRYNASNGAAMRSTDTNETVRIDAACNHLTFRGLQISNTGSTYQNRAFVQGTNGACSNLVVKDCIFEVSGSTHNVARQAAGTSGVLFINCVFIQRNGGSTLGVDSGSGGTTDFIGCTIVAPSNNTSTGTGLQRNYGTVTAKNCAIFGFSTDASGLDAASDYNATSLSDAASGLPDPTPDHNVYSLTYTSQFEQSSDASGAHDFRTKAGAGLLNAGLYDGTNSPQDIAGGTRADPPEIGAWELIPLGPPGGYYLLENGTDRYLLEDGSGLLLLEETDPFPVGYMKNYQNTLIRM